MSGSMHHILLVAYYRPHLVCCNSQSRAALIRHLRAKLGQGSSITSDSKRLYKSDSFNAAVQLAELEAAATT
jgi:hypothetical protein